MKKLVSFLILIACLNSCTKQESNQYAFDLSGIEPFWEIMDSLSADIEPSDKLWNSMFTTPGYKTLTEREFKKDWIKSYMRLGVMPSKQDVYKQWVSKNYWDTIRAVHMRKIYEHRSELNEFEKVINNPGFIRESMDIVSDYWDGKTLPEGKPPISFIFFDMDARGYTPVILDLMYALDKYQKGGLEELIAHEFHHYYRKKVLSFDYPDEEDPDHTVVHTINQIHLEGIADQIDKKISLANPYYASRNLRYQQNLLKTPGDMVKLDSLLAIYVRADDSTKGPISEGIARTARNSGHPMGYFMATTIWKYDSKESVYKDLGNPFKFFERYNECARRSDLDLPVFSDQAILTIRQLNKKYSTIKQNL